MYFHQTPTGLLFKRGKETLLLEPWGRDAMRVRATEMPSGVDGSPFSDKDWALLPAEWTAGEIAMSEEAASLRVGKLTARVDAYGKLRFENESGRCILREYYRTWERGVRYDDEQQLDQTVMIRENGRDYKPNGALYSVTARFEAVDGERFYGMGQYQYSHLDRKGSSLELKPYNTQAPVPFVVSSEGYGFLWNNPAIGRVSFGDNGTQWEAQLTRQLDYWICAGDTPAEIVEAYGTATGKPPMMPEFGLGFWQCKLRYQTQEELLEIARQYKRRGITPSVLVADYFHWPQQGDWRFDERYWPDVQAMTAELRDMGIETMVSVWPTVDRKSVNYEHMCENDLLVRVDKGVACTMECFGMEMFSDFTNPETRAFVWQQCKQHYWDKGVRVFWLDEAEPEYTAADFDLYRYHVGPAAETAHWYSVQYARAFYEGMRNEGIENPVHLIRCAWAGSQRYGALAWSGDVPSTFKQLRNQVCAGLSMGMAGISWWTADIGGFHGGNPDDEDFRELLVRWFQFGTFCPVMRLHGDRQPHSEPLGVDGGGMCTSGAPNEIWSYGENAERILTRFVKLREALTDHTREAMREAHERGTPVIKPVFYDYPQDSRAWEQEDEYLYGHGLLIAPVCERGARKRSVYLPAGACWEHVFTGERYEGGQTYTIDAPLEQVPCFAIADRPLLHKLAAVARA